MIPYFSLEKPYTDLNPCVSPKLWSPRGAISCSIHKALRMSRPNLRLRADTKCQSGTNRTSRFETLPKCHHVLIFIVRRYHRTLRETRGWDDLPDLPLRTLRSLRSKI